MPAEIGAPAPDFTLNGHQALALIAPRSFLLIAGEADRPESWQHLQEAQQVIGSIECPHRFIAGNKYHFSTVKNGFTDAVSLRAQDIQLHFKLGIVI